MGLATDKSLSNFVHSSSDVESQRRCQHLKNAFGGMGTLGIYWAIMMTMSGDATIPYNNENRNSLQASSSFKRYREKSSASGMRKETREQGVGIESETSLTCSLATPNREAATSPWHFLVVVRVRYSVSQFTLGNPRKNPSYFHTSNVHYGFTSPFSPISTNPWLTTLRHSHVPDIKNPHVSLVQRRLSVRSDSVLFITIFWLAIPAFFRFTDVSEFMIRITILYREKISQ